MVTVVLYEGVTDGRFDLVMETYPRHAAFVEEFAKSGDLIAIGTFDNPAENGSMGIFTTQDAANRFIAGDPFQTEGLVAKHRILAWDALVYGPLG